MTTAARMFDGPEAEGFRRVFARASGAQPAAPRMGETPERATTGPEGRPTSQGGASGEAAGSAIDTQEPSR